MRGLKRQTNVGEEKKRNIIMWSARILVILALLVFVWAQNNYVVNRGYVYAMEEMPKAFVGYKIVHISDICNKSLNLVASVEKQSPDVIILTGGYADSNGNAGNAVDVVNQLCKIAPVYYIYNTEDKADYLANTNAVNITDQRVALTTTAKEAIPFIKENYGNKIIKKATKGDEEAKEYIAYVQTALNETAGSEIYICGLNNYEDIQSADDFVGLTYELIGPHIEDITIVLNGNIKHTNAICRTDTDIILTGGTFGRTNEYNDYKKGMYANKNASIFVAGGIGNNGKFRVMNFPEYQTITLSDGTLKYNNPIENFFELFIKDVGNIYENDGGFTKYSSNGYKDMEQEQE